MQQAETTHSARSRRRKRRRAGRREASSAPTLSHAAQGAVDDAATALVTTDEPVRSRRSRRRRRTASGRDVAEVGKDLKHMLTALNGVLRSVEKLAWDTRALYDEVSAPFTRGDVQAAVGDASEAMGEATRRAQRLGRTGFMLGQIAASYRLYTFQSAFVSQGKAAEMLESSHRRNARRFYETSASQGGAFLKVGQLLSGRADFMPEAWIEELSRLQDAAPAIDFEAVQGVIEAELGRPLSMLFREFEPRPMAAASIGQVHRAVTHEGQTVAVKVQRPGIAALIEADMDLLEKFLEVMRASLPEVDHETIVQELRSSLRAELDYRLEAGHTRHMASFFAQHTDGSIMAPSVIEALCTGRVLTMEFIEGRNLSHVLDELGERVEAGDSQAQRELSHHLGRLLEAYLRQVLQGGRFQSDPHPGNFMLAADGRLVVLDYGSTTTLSPTQRERYVAVMRGFLGGKEQGVGQLLLDAGFVTRSGSPDTLLAFTRALLGKVQQMMAEGRFSLPSADELRREAAGLWSALENDPVVKMPSDFVMIARVFGGLGGLMTHHTPDIDVARHVLPALLAASMPAAVVSSDPHIAPVA